MWPIKADQTAFTDAMALFDPESDVSKLDDDEILHEGFRFFSDQIREWAQTGPQSTEEHLDASLGRRGQAADIADMVAFLDSDDGQWLTGQNLWVTGG